MSCKQPDQRVARILRRCLRLQVVVTLAIVVFLVVGAVIIGDTFSVLVGLAVAAVAYVGYRAYEDNV